MKLSSILAVLSLTVSLTAHAGIPLNGIPVNGIPVNGIPVNGIPVNGIAINGIAVNGISVNPDRAAAAPNSALIDLAARPLIKD